MLDLRIGPVEVAGEGGGQPVLAPERLRERVEIEEAKLDEVGAEPAAPHHLGAQRLRDLLDREHAACDQQLPETSHELFVHSGALRRS